MFYLINKLNFDRICILKLLKKKIKFAHNNYAYNDYY